MTLYVAVYAAVMLLFVSICPTVTQSRTERGWLASMFRCLGRLFSKRPLDGRQVD